PLHTLPAPPAQEATDHKSPADFRQLMQNVLKRPDKSA
ncbi:flagellar assembly protein FliO, partial [Serratia fonticola]